MLVGIATITESALAHAAELQDADASFSEAYFRDLRTRIDAAAHTVLGADNAAALRAATLDLHDAADQAARELGLTKTWIESKYAGSPARRDELLNNLGFKRLYTAAVNKKQQEELGQLLERVSQGIDAGLAAEFASAGLPETRVRTIRSLAATFNLKNVHQETQKGRRTERTAEDLATLNALYSEVIGVSKLARHLFRDRPVIQAAFVYDNTAPAAHARKTAAPATDKG